MVNVVYDVDDVLNNLVSHIISKLGLPEPSRYAVRECTEYIKEQQDTIIAMFSDPDVFREISFVDGAKDICDIERSGMARVWINSCNANEKVGEVKRQALIEHIPNLSPNRIHFQYGDGLKKTPLPMTDIIVEDSFKNLLAYPKDVIKILIDRSCNKAEYFNTTDKEHQIIRVVDLNSANTLIKTLVYRQQTG